MPVRVVAVRDRNGELRELRELCFTGRERTPQQSDGKGVEACGRRYEVEQAAAYRVEGRQYRNRY
ncbi:MAG: hypothetical protein LUC18_00740 [Porphyromonadaceae bacterium]|nr:hypothetical protein [Porphyromonadaceae bacterium]